MELDAVVAVKAVVAEDVVVLELTAAAGGELPAWAPGAHVDLILRPGLERQFSLCGDPEDRGVWRVAVLRERAGRGGSAYVHDTLAVGDRIQVRGPRNHFPLVEADEYLFIAGGIGITPLLPMMRAVAARGRRWRLVYGGRRAAGMAFTDELPTDEKTVTLWPQDEFGLIDLEAALGEPREGFRVYCCGPEPLIAAVEQRWPPGALHTERFRPRAVEAGGDVSFVVRLDYTGIDVTVGAGQSIVQAVEAAGVEVVTSCREGTCGTCETSVLDGLPLHRDSVLTDEERAAGDTMMICCGRSLTPLLVLDL
ncbi:PDR/VanB family oxidoreductase [Dactylosporangium sp. CS-033363]|uniref:PDR/VanB family oxidoreductase n=1 Tax=Dactylosporangium sp. CS-033363 TaxID=3239935 RepID=UPI003D9154B8